MNMEFNQPVFAIGIVAHMVGVHQQTLRNYERWELVVPHRSEGGTRLYSNRDVEIIRQILKWKEELGLTLAGIEVMTKLLRKINLLEEKLDNLTLEIIRLRDGNYKFPIE